MLCWLFEVLLDAVVRRLIGVARLQNFVNSRNVQKREQQMLAVKTSEIGPFRFNCHKDMTAQDLKDTPPIPDINATRG